MTLTDLLGPLETEVMTLLWGMDRASVRQVVDVLQERRPIAYTTVMTIMNNLVGKGLLKRTRRGKAYLYVPRLTRAAFFERKSAEAVSAVVARFGDLAVVRFVQTVAQLSPEERARLEALATQPQEVKRPRKGSS